MDGLANVLTFEIKLKHSRTEILPALRLTLRHYRDGVLGKPPEDVKVPSHPPVLNHYCNMVEYPGGDFEECLYIEVDLRHDIGVILRAINSFVPRKKATGPRFKQKRKVNPLEALDAVREFESQGKRRSRQKAAWKLGVKENTLRYAYRQAVTLLGFKASPPVPDCSRCPDKGSSKCFECPDMERYLSQLDVPQQDYLPNEPLTDREDPNSPDIFDLIDPDEDG
jgi:hypothetical protein